MAQARPASEAVTACLRNDGHSKMQAMATVATEVAVGFSSRVAISTPLPRSTANMCQGCCGEASAGIFLTAETLTGAALLQAIDRSRSTNTMAA